MCFNIKLLLAFVAVSATLCRSDSFSEDIQKYRDYGGSLDLQDAFDVFYTEPCKSMRKIDYLLHIFNRNCPNITTYFPRMVRRKQHVFIAVEGTHKETKLVITKMLARKLNGKFRFSPPYFMVNTDDKYTDSRTMSRAYYCLGYYSTAYNIVQLLQYMPVVTGGYWMDQLAFGVVASFENKMPHPDSPLYTWPRDLLMPDVIFFLNLPSHNLKNTFTADDPMSFRSRLIQFYRNWGNSPPVVEINSTNVHRDVINILTRYIERELSYRRHLMPTVPTRPRTYVPNQIKNIF